MTPAQREFSKRALYNQEKSEQNIKVDYKMDAPPIDHESYHTSNTSLYKIWKTHLNKKFFDQFKSSIWVLS